MKFETATTALARIIREQITGLTYDVADVAPDNDRDMIEHYRQTGRLLVWSGGSSKTIFGDCRTNWAFRAIHDQHHDRGNLAFDCDSERKVCGLQVAGLFARYGANHVTEAVARLIRLEIVGQCSHFEDTGQFIDDQNEWTRRQWRLTV